MSTTVDMKDLLSAKALLQEWRPPFGYELGYFAIADQQRDAIEKALSWDGKDDTTRESLRDKYAHRCIILTEIQAKHTVTYINRFLNKQAPPQGDTLAQKLHSKLPAQSLWECERKAAALLLIMGANEALEAANVLLS